MWAGGGQSPLGFFKLRSRVSGSGSRPSTGNTTNCSCSLGVGVGSDCPGGGTGVIVAAIKGVTNVAKSGRLVGGC